jgi:hypothetical protein
MSDGYGLKVREHVDVGIRLNTTRQQDNTDEP